MINDWSLNNLSLLIINTQHVEHIIVRSLPYNNAILFCIFCFYFVMLLIALFVLYLKGGEKRKDRKHRRESRDCHRRGREWSHQKARESTFHACFSCVGLRERERGGGEGGALHNTMKPVDHTPRSSLKRITGEGSVSSWQLLRPDLSGRLVIWIQHHPETTWYAHYTTWLD